MENYWDIANPLKYLKFLTWEKLKLHKEMIPAVSTSRMTWSSNWWWIQSQLRASLVRRGFHQGSEGAVQQNCFWISLVLTVFFHPHFLTYHDHRRGPFLGFDLVFLLIDGRRIFFHCISGQLKKLLSFYDIYFFFCDYFEAYKM